MRLVVWAVRGLSIAKVLAPDPDEIHKSVALLSRMLEAYGDRSRDKWPPGARAGSFRRRDQGEVRSGSGGARETG